MIVVLDRFTELATAACAVLPSKVESEILNTGCPAVPLGSVSEGPMSEVMAPPAASTKPSDALLMK